MNFFKYILILCFITYSWSCVNTDKPAEIESTADETTEPEIVSLKGTEWKLAGFVDAIGTVKELEPKDCKDCYTIIFDSESEAHGYSECNTLIFQLLPELIVGGTEMACPTEDGMLYEKFIFETAKSYELKENQLRFFDSEKENYLLFKLNLVSLKGTEWKLVGLVDSINTVKELEPKNCERCYTIIFDSESEAHGYSECNTLIFQLLPELIVGGTEMACPTEDGNLYEKFIFETAKSYELKENQLRFFDKEKKNYLLFKLNLID